MALHDEPEAPRAFSIERLSPEQLLVVVPDVAPGADPALELHALVGQVRPNLFVLSKQLGPFSPDMAIAVGEHLASEGRKAKLVTGVDTGLQLPT